MSGWIKVCVHVFILVSVLLLVILFNIIVQAVSVTGKFIVLMYYNTNKAVACHDAVW